jgi:hypothetical protein
MVAFWLICIPTMAPALLLAAQKPACYLLPQNDFFFET